MKPQKTKIILILVISIVSGLLAGFLGCVLLLLSSTINIPFVGSLEKYFPKKEITIKTQEKIIVSRDVLVEESLSDLKKQIVSIALAKKKTDSILTDSYLEKEILGSGFALTNDGWIISTESVISGGQKNYLVLFEDNRFYPVEKIIEDPFTGLVFLKISAADLTVAKLADKDDISLGQEILIFDKNKNLSVSFLSDLKHCPVSRKTDLIRSTEQFSEFLLLDKDLDKSFNGSALIGLDKSFVGIAGKNREIIPSYYFKNLISQVLKSGEIEKPRLGIDFIDLASVVLDRQDTSYTDLPDKGALVYGLDKNSPAMKAGLKKDDIILRVGSEVVNHRVGLQELLDGYKKGDVLELAVLRKGEEIIVELEL